MASLQTRPDDIIFAQSAQTGEVSDFNDLARGWGSTLTYSAGIPPMEWFNFIGQRSDKGLHYVLQQGVDAWNSLENYPTGALVKVVADNCLYRALRNNLNKEPKSNGSDWVKVLDITAASAAARQVGRSSGNVVQIGAFGIGANAEQITDSTSPTQSGFYGLPATGAGGPVSGMATEILHIQYDSNTATQIAKGHNKRTLYTRDKVNGSWTAWEGQYGPSNKPTAQELGINQDFIPMDGSESIRGNLGTVGWVHIARTTSDLFRAANSNGVGVAEIVGNVAGGMAVQHRLTSVSISANSHTAFLGMWGSVAMTSIKQVLQSGGSTRFDFDVCRAGTIADRRTTGLQVDGGASRVTTTSGFTLQENGVRVYSPNNPQPVDVSWAVRRIRLGSETDNGRTGGESFVLRVPAGHAMTGLNVHSKSGREDEINNVYSRPIQMNINEVWYTVDQL